ncbi:type IX secretion system membrane protein PorP/SprF [Aggregatimonas sangjinii]|uniref:Type IX secretion system membrane protein PorP/SprF n=2 Tax=Aggregatimonas sangjinii TaxID=2583587 RepID=A0A5B7T021_9FLAO|nr:type IX secretion system membrane protein PorP/SprF [Aggregatimonas sangjinii]
MQYPARIIYRHRSLLLFAIAIVLTSIGYGQKEPQYTQYMYNIGSFNPAYVGTTETPEITAMYRTQWIGLDGAPTTLRLGTNIPLSNEKMGLGFNVINDQLGPMSQTFIDVAYSYQLNVSESTKLSFGVDAGGSLLNVDFSKGTFENPGEPILGEEQINNFYLTIGAGLFLYDENWYFGASVPNFLTDATYNQEVATVIEDKMQFNFIGGYVFELSPNTKFKPAFLINYINGAPLNTNVSANFLFNEKFVFGASYRFGNAVSALAGFQISDPIYFGVSYDYSTNGLGEYNSGTPEVVLRFQIGRTGSSSRSGKSNNLKKDPKQIDTPRFF